MSIIYSYPIKGTPANDDLILISDSASSPQFATKQIKVSSLPGGSSSGVSSFNTLTGVVTITGGTNVTLNPVGNNIEINASGGGGTPAIPLNSVQFNNASAFGGSANLTFTGTPNPDTLTLAHKLDIKGDGTSNAGKLKLYCQDNTTPHYVELIGPAHSGSPVSYSITLPNKIATQSAVSGGRVLEVDASGVGNWITTPASTAPSGDDGQYQYKNGSSFAGADNLRFDSDKIHIGKGGGTPTRGQLVMYGDGTNASDIQLYNSTNNRYLTLAQQAGATQDLTLTFPGQASGGNNKILESDSSGQLSWIDTPSGGSGISFSGTTANGIATYSNSTTANVSSVFTVSGSKLSAPAGSLADPSIEVGAIGGLYAASGGILLAHNGANAIGVTSSSIVNYKLTQFEAGLKFGSAGSTLSRYEEGTWTPTAYVPSGTAPTVTSSNGTYTIIGDICHITFKIVVTGSSSSNAAMMVGGIPAAAYGDSNNGEKSGGNLFVNSDSNTPAHYPSTFMIGYNTLTMIVQGGSKNSATSPFGLKAQDVVASWYRPSGGTGITLEGSSTYKLL
jgi:hypothetical protein